VCVTGSGALRRIVQRALSAAGLAVEFADTVAEVAASPPAVVVIDKQARVAASTPTLVALADVARVVLIGSSLLEDDVITLVRNSGIDHVVPELAKLEERDLVVVARKWLSGDIFGIEKYMPWGSEVSEVEVGCYDDKRPCCFAVSELAEEFGARRNTVSKIEVVTDELLMNALYDAPAAFEGSSPREYAQDHATSKESLAPARVRFGSDGRYFVVSVEDAYGLLRKEALLDHVVRARAVRGKPKRVSDDLVHSGAGLGMYFIMSAVAQLVINVEVGKRTEVACFFDLQAGVRLSRAAHSLHFFSEKP